MIWLPVALFGGIVAVTIYGWATVPEDRRFPVSLGVPPSVEGTVRKRVGLIIYLAIGAFIFAVTLTDSSSGPAIELLASFLLAFFLAIELHTIRRLSR
ncbi:MAG: hypothetical protein ACRDLB_03055 [Actinomycetota bacterium]